MSKTPLWLTPERKESLIRLFVESRGFCVYGHPLCQIPEHHYTVYIEYLIHDWKELDRDLRNAELEAEMKALHHVPQRRFPIEGRFNAVSRDIYAESQPLFFLKGQSVSGVTLKPFVVARISSTYIHLHVDLSGILKQVSKSKRRKALRYGKPLPHEITTEINREVLNALRDYYSQ
jgi:hypothetical protein